MGNRKRTITTTDKGLAKLSTGADVATRSVWRDAETLARMLCLGEFAQSGRYPRNRKGLANYLRDQNINLAREEVERLLKTRATYAKHAEKHPEVIKKVERIGLSKAYAATVYVTSENVVELLDAIINRNIPHANLRKELSKMYPDVHHQRAKPDAKKIRQKKAQRAIDVIVNSPRNGDDEGGGVMLGGRMYVPRSGRLSVEEESRMCDIFQAACKQKNMNIDQLMMELARHIHDNMLTNDGREQVRKELQKLSNANVVEFRRAQ